MNEEKKSIAKTPETPILKFFSNPLVGIIGTTASIIGVILALIFYIQGRERRKLIFYENPGKAIIAKAGHSSKIEILIEGKQIKRDVTATQVAFWNDGKKSIKPENILKPLIIKTKDKIPIVEAKIRKKSREVIDIDLDQSKKSEGEIKVNWNILEKNDGTIIQITYLGNPEVTISANAIIEGQGEIKANVKKVNWYRYFVVTIFFIIFILNVSSGFNLKKIFFKIGKTGGSILFNFLMLILLIVFIISELYEGMTTPPFGF